MDEPLNILAIEPYYGGVRRHFLQTLQRRSRHKWDVLHLPAVRYGRRLEVSGRWFAEVLARRLDRLGDVLFCTDALNLAEVRQLLPPLVARPSVVYFHDNLLPAPGQANQPMIDGVNLSSALVADEVWFNSLHHLRTFMGRAAALMGRGGPGSSVMLPGAGDEGQRGTGGGAGLSLVSAKARLMPPPVEIAAFRQIVPTSRAEEERGRTFVDTRGADHDLLAAGVRELQQRGVRPELVVLGPWGRLPQEVIVSAVDESDEIMQMEALAGCGTYLSASTNAYSDNLAVMAAGGGLRLAVPASGVYIDLVPPELHSSFLYEPNPQFLASLLQDVWSLPLLAGDDRELIQSISGHEAASAVSAIDWRLDRLVGL